MAEGLFRAALKGRKDVEVASAGVGAVHGQPPSTHSVDVCRAMGIDISRQRSQPLTDELVEWADLIFVMTRGHRDTIQMMFPEAVEKTYLVCERDPELRRRSLDVPDPIGLGLYAYEDTRDTIVRALPSLLELLDSDQHDTHSIRSDSCSLQHDAYTAHRPRGRPRRRRTQGSRSPASGEEGSRRVGLRA